MPYSQQKLLIANRGEIAIRILRSAKRLQISTVCIYAQSDATAPHVVEADEAVALHPEDTDPGANSGGYLDAEHIVDICVAQHVTLVHPGYGFLSENPNFAALVESKGITWLGPPSHTIEAMGLKHVSRNIATKAGVPIVPGSDGLVCELEEAKRVARKVGYPVMLKSTAGGGGMSLIVCYDDQDLSRKFPATKERAKSLFHNEGLFLERYFPAARHIEIQVFGNGLGHVIHVGERECSVQRRYQKVIEEAPSPFLVRHPELREKMCDAAVRMCQSMQYASAGTVEFLVDDTSREFFFLEMNTRLQVEHPVTEATHPGLDLVELMIRQGIAQRESRGGLAADELVQERPGSVHPDSHAIEARVYCENPAADFRPSPGVLQHVQFPTGEGWEWLRVDSWVETGTIVTPYFDPLLAKIIVTGSTREEAIIRMKKTLKETRICGPPSNLKYLQTIMDSQTWQAGNATTTFLSGVRFTPRAVDVLSGGIETTIQDFPGRKLGLGIPRSGPMDFLAHQAANILVGNLPGTEALEVTLVGCRLRFHVPAMIAITGAPVKVSVNGKPVRMWTTVHVPPDGKVTIGTADQVGWRAYMAIQGGFPDVSAYLGSKSTSMGLGGYQGRALNAGDQLGLSDNCDTIPTMGKIEVPDALVPAYPDHWTIHCLAGPHCDEEFVTSSGIDAFFAAKWTVSASSNRMGIRLEGPKIAWARMSGGEGGSHPSNIHDSGYALGTVNLNGDTPVILTNEGPDMGGYLCICTVASAEQWKLGQLRPGNTIRFKRISYYDAMRLMELGRDFLNNISTTDDAAHVVPSLLSVDFVECKEDPKLRVIREDTTTGRPKVVFRQAGDSAILIEYGEWLLSFSLRARVHALERELQRQQVPGIWAMSPCIRSTMIHYDPLVIPQFDLLDALVAAEVALPARMDDVTFPGRRIMFPLVLDDQWSKEALARYTRAIRDRAVYLPSNVEYLARNNGLEGGAEEALRLLVASDWLVFGVGFYLACPFLVPVDPRCRLVGQKMNPSRTYTPRGALGIAGLVAAIYPIASPGGYQLFGRTLPPWRTWGKEGRPWLLDPFDQVRFKIVSEAEYVKLEKQFDAGRYAFEVEPTTFSMAEHDAFVESIKDEVEAFKLRQAEGVAREEAKETELLADWEQRRKVQTSFSGGVTDAEDASDTLTANNLQIAIHSPTAGTVQRVCCAPGDMVEDGDTVLVVLEAMKTEVGVAPGEDGVGRRVVKVVGSGASVGMGDAVVVLA